MKKRSPIRQFLRLVRFVIAIRILTSMWQGKIEWWIALLLYLFLWIVFIAIDAPIAYREQRLTKRATDDFESPRKLSYPLNQLPRNNVGGATRRR